MLVRHRFLCTLFQAEKAYFEKKTERSKETTPQAEAGASVLMSSQLPLTPTETMDSDDIEAGGSLDPITQGQEMDLFSISSDDDDVEKSPLKKKVFVYISFF